MARSSIIWQPQRPAEGFYSSEVQAPHKLPVRTFLPTGYEPNYPYPLLVLFHAAGSCEQDVLKLAPKLSRRNYICISVRGCQAVGFKEDGRLGFGWGSDAPADPAVEDYIFRAIELTRRQYHVHSERIYLAGFREGGNFALRLGLTYPDKIAGVIALNSRLPRQNKPRFYPPAMRHLRVLMAHGFANPVVPLTDARADARLLYTAGVDAKLLTYPTTNRIHPDMLRDIDRWLMGSLEAEWE